MPDLVGRGLAAVLASGVEYSRGDLISKTFDYRKIKHFGNNYGGG